MEYYYLARPPFFVLYTYNISERFPVEQDHLDQITGTSCEDIYWRLRSQETLQHQYNDEAAYLQASNSVCVWHCDCIVFKTRLL